MADSGNSFPFMALPEEIKLSIMKECFQPQPIRLTLVRRNWHMESPVWRHFQLLLVSKRLNLLARPFLRNSFDGVLSIIHNVISRWWLSEHVLPNGDDGLQVPQNLIPIQWQQSIREVHLPPEHVFNVSKINGSFLPGRLQRVILVTIFEEGDWLASVLEGFLVAVRAFPSRWLIRRPSTEPPYR